MGIKYSARASFYPKEAEARGATPSQVGVLALAISYTKSH